MNSKVMEHKKIYICCMYSLVINIIILKKNIIVYNHLINGNLPSVTKIQVKGEGNLVLSFP